MHIDKTIIKMLKAYALIIAATIIAAVLLSACTKRTETCYTCKYVSAGVEHKRDVCTDGAPEAELPTHDANGRIGWGCKKK